MSAALQLPYLWAAANLQQKRGVSTKSPACGGAESESIPDISYAFYRKHTEKMLLRYLYASMLVGRAPAILREPIARGWVSSRRVKTFEDAVIFVLDVERCLERLDAVDRELLSRIALQEYTHEETAEKLGFSVRTIYYKYALALDRLSELLFKAGLLVLPKS